MERSKVIDELRRRYPTRDIQYNLLDVLEVVGVVTSETNELHEAVRQAQEARPIFDSQKDAETAYCFEREQNITMLDTNRAVRAELTKEQGDADRLRETLAAVCAERDTLTEQLAETHNALVKIRQEERETQETLDDVVDQRDDAYKQLNDALEDKTAVEETLARVREQRDTVKSELNRVRETLTSESARADRLAAKLEGDTYARELAASVEKLKAEHVKQAKRIAELVDEVKELTLTNDALQAACDCFRGKLQTIKKTAASVV
jgi:chromosome segregation ATPase